MNKKIKESIYNYRFLIIFGIVAIILYIGYIIYLNSNHLGYYNAYSKPDDKEYIIYRYEENEYQPVDADIRILISDYYKDFIYNLLNNKQEVWNILTKENKKEKFNNDYKQFEKYVNSIITYKTFYNTIEKYKIDENVYQNKYSIVDSEENYIVFYDNGLWNIKAEINGKISLQ